MEDALEQAINIFDLEALARERLTPMAYDYYASGAHDEVALRENRAAFERIKLRHRVLVDVSERDARTTVLGHPVSTPILIAPTAFQGMACADAELATARAASAHGTIMMLSTLSNTAVEEVVAATTGPVFFQLYVYKDRAATRALVERAQEAGCQALVLTADAPLLGTRERDVRNGFHLPAGLRIENMLAKGQGKMPGQSGESGLASYVAQLLDPGLTWADLDWLASITDLPILVKGVARADDARRALDHGAAGIVVSNHGGRQLDSAVATIDALPEVVEAVGDTLEVLVDGGVRRGSDVLKALALGARAVLVGRPVLWGLGAGGQAGVERALTMLRDELDLAMALTGAPTLADIGRDLIRRG